MDKSRFLTFGSWMTKAVYFFLIILCTVSGQSVILENMQSVSTCSSGLRHGMDFYLFKGIVNASVAKYSNLIDFHIKSPSSNSFTYMCTASLATCITPNPQPCYCAVNKTGDIYEIFANRSAILSDNGALIRIQWDSSSGDSVVSNEASVNGIYDLNAVKLSLTLNRQPMNCPAVITNGSVIKFTCENSPRPCVVSIANDTGELLRGVDSVSYTFIISQLANSTFNLTFGYSVCGGPMSTFSKCEITLEDVITTTPSATVTPFPVQLKAWAIAMSVIYYIFIIVIIVAGIVIIVFAIKLNKKTVIFYVCIGFLVFSEILCIVLIIVFAQANPYESGTDIALDLWKIMLIIFCIINGLLLIAAVVVVIWSYVCSKNSNLPTSPNRGSAEITSPATVNASNTRTKTENKVNSAPNANTVSNGTEKTDAFHLNEIQRQEEANLHNKSDEIKKNDSEGKKKGRKKKSKQKNKDTKEQEKDGSSTNRSLPVPLSGDKKLLPIHPQPPTGTKMTASNPYG